MPRPIALVTTLNFVARLAAVAAFAAFGASAKAQQAQPLNAIVAIVNNAVITAFEVERLAKNLLAEGRAEDIKNARVTALDLLIDRRVMLSRGERLGIVVSDEALERRLQEIRQEANFDDAALRDYAKQAHGLDYPQFREFLREEMLAQAVFYNEVFLRARVREDEVNRFLLTQTEAGQRKQYRLGHILISVAANADEAEVERKRQKAETLRARAAAGEDFLRLAREESDTPKFDLGHKTEAELPTAFAGLLPNLKTGEVAETLQTARGFHVIKLLGERGGNMRQKVTRARLAHIFLPLERRVFAERLRQQIVDGALAFEDAAKEHSIDNISAEAGGDLGWFGDDDMPEYFAAVAATLQAGDISPLVQSPFGWHILLLRQKETSEVDLQLIRDRARRLLRERRAERQRHEWLKQLRAAASVRVLDPAYLPVGN